ALLLGQRAQRGFDAGAALILLERAGEEGLGLWAGRCSLSPGLPAPATPPVQDAVLHASVEVGGRVRRTMPRAPEADEPLLNDVPGMGGAGDPWADEEDQRGPVPLEPVHPLIATVRHVSSPAAGEDSL